MAYQQLAGEVDVCQLHQRWPDKFPYLLESVAKNDKTGRYSLLFYRPSETHALTHPSEADFLACFNENWLAHQAQADASIPAHIPFRGGWFVFFAYELAEQIEPSLSLTPPPYPVAFAARCPAAIVVDHVAKLTYLVVDGGDANAALQTMADCVDCVRLTAAEVAAVGETIAANPLPLINLQEDEPSRFLSGVEKSRNYIIEGDVFQVNLSRAWQFAMPQTATDQLYTQLRQNNPAPFAASCHLPGVSIVSSSPERLVSVTNGRAETRPIAGTRPRGDSEVTDKAFSTELLGHFKERAEHIMLIDLERNDLGRICQAGTVTVDELMVIESYAHVHHIVSNVVGQLRDDITPADVIRAVFPGGTITGCPKVRCMEIIHELEQTYRGVYTGSVGYVNHNGDMDTNILIRSFACHNDGVLFRAGAGVVYDSVAESELAETRNKAKGLLKALEQ